MNAARTHSPYLGKCTFANSSAIALYQSLILANRNDLLVFPNSVEICQAGLAFHDLDRHWFVSFTLLNDATLPNLFGVPQFGHP